LAMSSRTPASGVMVTTPLSGLALSTSTIFIATFRNGWNLDGSEPRGC
jgi:hypothetical protein